MAVDYIRYDILAQEALRGLVRTVLASAAKNGLPGEHHFSITFDTHANGVRMSQRLREQYPEDITIILQHQFWDLVVNKEDFEVGLSFGGVPERLTVPFAAIKGFLDPSVQFGLQFETLSGDDGESERPDSLSAGKAQSAPNAAMAPDMDSPATPGQPAPDKPSAGGEVVRLDRFRKK